MNAPTHTKRLEISKFFRGIFLVQNFEILESGKRARLAYKRFLARTSQPARLVYSESLRRVVGLFLGCLDRPRVAALGSSTERSSVSRRPISRTMRVPCDSISTQFPPISWQPRCIRHFTHVSNNHRRSQISIPLIPGPAFSISNPHALRAGD